MLHLDLEKCINFSELHWKTTNLHNSGQVASSISLLNPSVHNLAFDVFLRLLIILQATIFIRTCYKSGILFLLSNLMDKMVYWFFPVFQDILNIFSWMYMKQWQFIPQNKHLFFKKTKQNSTTILIAFDGTIKTTHTKSQSRF